MAASTPVAIAPCGEFPNEIKEQARAFHSTLTNVKETLSPLLSTNQDVVTEELSPLDKARLDLTLLYSLNSLFWMYLCTVGEDPKQHSVRRELMTARKTAKSHHGKSAGDRPDIFPVGDSTCHVEWLHLLSSKEAACTVGNIVGIMSTKRLPNHLAMGQIKILI
ncbi:ribosomal RNA processing 47 isoform X1 [Dermacentor variabilis]|uniref:ribosomal RNA processing 47 isoform X1 n=1 Tax=Dermacentor variabilis TaxID=34621 RepID=UPI003F5C1574